MTDRETELREQLAQAHRRHYEETAPIIAELAEIEGAKPPRPLVLSLENKVPQHLLDQLKRSRDLMAAQLGIQASEP